MNRRDWNVIALSACFRAMVGSSVWAAEPRRVIPWQTDYQKAHDRRVDERRPMLIFITMDSCPHCHRMLDTTYADVSVARAIADEYVPTMINATEDTKLAQRFGVRIYPTTFVVGPNNRLIDKIEGYVPAETFRVRLATASRRLAAQTAPVSR